MTIRIASRLETEIVERAAAEGISTDQFIDRLLHPCSPQNEADATDGDFGGKSVYEMFTDLLGTGDFGPTDLGRRSEEYLARGFGSSSSPRKASP